MTTFFNLLRGSDNFLESKRWLSYTFIKETNKKNAPTNEILLDWIMECKKEPLSSDTLLLLLPAYIS